ncbi:MAG: hypothetical protein NTZ38_03700 [Candidatus Taylorbacteria bacterium]|nr:hypothetical protein [Candidatus Taylorbacteria bacterium]
MTASSLISQLVNQFQTDALPHVENFLITLAPLFLAIFLAMIFWDVWLQYVRAKNFIGIKYTVLELRLPKDTFKSPLAMESVLHALHNTSDGKKYVQYWKGETRPWYSLELISIEGQVKFLIWTEDRRKVGLMGALYSQFPGIEIDEREDYSRSVHFDPATMKMYGVEFKFTKPDPYPIKTYVDYGLDKDPKEEFKVDPLVPLIEYLGSVKVNQQVWFQFLIRAHTDDQKKPGHLFKKTDLWHDESEKLVNELLMRDPKTKVAGMKDEATGFTKLPSISKGEQEIAESIERGMTKLAFDVGIRAIYIAPKESFDTPFGIGGIVGGMKHFNSESLNGFKPDESTGFDYPWQDYKNFRKNRKCRLMLAAYKRRSYFYPPFQGKPMVMNTEELATIYHFPGSTAATPGLERVPSKKAEAPTNLPV